MISRGVEDRRFEMQIDERQPPASLNGTGETFHEF
jgi:hypothetical protein